MVQVQWTRYLNAPDYLFELLVQPLRNFLRWNSTVVPQCLSTSMLVLWVLPPIKPVLKYRFNWLKAKSGKDKFDVGEDPPQDKFDGKALA